MSTEINTLFRETAARPARTRLRIRNGKLPRGLWVGKQKRKGAPERDMSQVMAGKRPWHIWPEDYYPEYYYRLQKRGLKPVKQSTDTDHYPTAVERGIEKLEAWLAQNWIAKKWGLAVAPPGWREMPKNEKPKEEPKVELRTGDVFEAFLKIYSNVRPVQAARRLYLTAHGHLPWDPKNPSSRKGSIHKDSPLIELVDNKPFREIFSSATVKGYFKVKQGGTYQPLKPAREHNSYNAIYQCAKELFNSDARAHCYEGIEFPPELAEFLAVPALKEVEANVREKLIEPEEWEAMYHAAQALWRNPDEKKRALGLGNWMVRTLGLRTSELLNAKKSWLIFDRDSDRWYLEIADRPEQPYVGSFKEGKTYNIKGSDAGLLPVHPDLMAVFNTRGKDDYLCFPEGSETSRYNVLSREHNTFVKTYIGHDGGHMGVHRLRSHAATYIARNFSESLASVFLRHADMEKKEGRTGRKFYIIPPEFAELPYVTDAAVLKWGRRHELKKAKEALPAA